MGAQLKIDSDEAFGLAAELADLRGESIDAVVTRALQETLERDCKAHDDEVAREQQVEETIACIRAIAADIRSHMKHPLPSSDHDHLCDYLYDDGVVSPKPGDQPD